jgi:hypothetical protein
LSSPRHAEDEHDALGARGADGRKEEVDILAKILPNNVGQFRGHEVAPLLDERGKSVGSFAMLNVKQIPFLKFDQADVTTWDRIRRKCP